MADKPFKKPPNPRGFRPVGLDDARHKMQSVLNQALIEVRQRGFDATVTVFTNRDGTIDGEITAKEPRGKGPLHVFEAIRESLPTRMPGFWISSGSRFSARRDEDNYNRHKSGVSQVQTYYQRYTPGKSAGNMFVGQEIAEVVEKRQRKKVDGVFVRIHWNQPDLKPGRLVEPESGVARRQDRPKGGKRK